MMIVGTYERKLSSGRICIPARMRACLGRAPRIEMCSDFSGEGEKVTYLTLLPEDLDERCPQRIHLSEEQLGHISVGRDCVVIIAGAGLRAEILGIEGHRKLYPVSCSPANVTV